MKQVKRGGGTKKKSAEGGGDQNMCAQKKEGVGDKGVRGKALTRQGDQTDLKRKDGNAQGILEKWK